MDDHDDRLIAQLAGLGVDAGVDAAPAARKGPRSEVLRLARGDSAQDYELVRSPNVRLSSVPASTSDRALFVRATHIAVKTGEALRRAGAQYLDTAGNAWIEFGDVLVDVRGRPRPAGAASRATATGNLFSSGRAQVVLALLAWPQLWDVPQRVVAQAAGVSLGQAHNTLTLLAQAGYHQGQRRTGRVDLLDMWAAAFPAGLAQRLTLANYHGQFGSVKKVRPDDVVAVSGEAAVPDFRRPAALTLYVAELNPRLAIVNRWRVDGEPNVVVRRKFWNDPLSADAALPVIDVAPWPLVYADLLASDDPRARAVARQWRERHEQPR